MERYVKKPIVVEAEQFLPFQDDRYIPQSNVACVYMDVGTSKTGWSIKTLEGRYDVMPKDWIIKGIKGEFYPCKPDIFEATYEKYDPTDDPTDDIMAGIIKSVSEIQQGRTISLSELYPKDKSSVPRDMWVDEKIAKDSLDGRYG